MANSLTLAWVPGQSATSQTVQFRIKNTSTWVDNSNITPVNPMTRGVSSAVVSGISNNAIYQFQVLSNCCPGTEAVSLAVEGIIYIKPAGSTATASAGIISVSQDPLPQIDTVSYRVALNATPTVIIQTITTTGSNPNGSFSVLRSGVYQVTFAYTTSINGVNSNSYDANQNNAWYVIGTVTI